MAKKHIKRYSISLTTREMQIKPLWVSPQPTRITIIEKIKIKTVTNTGENVETLESSYIAAGN